MSVEEESKLSVQLKWPNDLYVSSRKLAGILTETGPFCATSGRPAFVIIGIGINVNSRLHDFDLSVRNHITSLHNLTTQLYELDRLLVKIAQKLAEYVTEFAGMREDLFFQWQRRDFLRGRQLTWHTLEHRSIRGVGLGLGSDGRYHIEDTTGKKHLILAGDLIPGSLQLTTSMDETEHR